MISIECHRSGERCPGKREFDNRIEINRVRSGEIMWLFPLSQKKYKNMHLEQIRSCGHKFLNCTRLEILTHIGPTQAEGVVVVSVLSRHVSPP